jgi:hypothetical protein
LLVAVQDILARYHGTAVTVRQLYYRLVAERVIPNTQKSYKNLGAALTVWRRSREISLDAFEDRTRRMNRLDDGWRNDNPELWTEAWFKEAVKQARSYHLARWYQQDYRVVVAVEKQALEGPFTEVCTELAVDLAVCRGYPSLSFLNEVADALGGDDPQRDGRQNVLLYFGDFDPSGLNIPEVVERDLLSFFRSEVEVHRMALTRPQIDERNLPPAPVKLTDSRAAGFVSEHGEEVYELDAIEPLELQELIRASVDEYFDDRQAVARDALVAEGLDRIDSLLQKAKIGEFLASLGKKGGKR